MKTRAAPLVLALFLMAAVCVWVWLGTGAAPHASSSGSVATEARMENATATAMTGAHREESKAQAETSGRQRRAFLLALHQGQLSLQAQEDVEGDFAPAGYKGELWPGMLRCRLVNLSGEVLAEEIMRAPDMVCRVLDRGKLTTFTDETAPVLFQTRLPRVEGAARLVVTRVTALDSAEPDAPVGVIHLNTP